ncbi:hypothetical protein M3G50_07685 [Brachybacterium muris]|uniref:hypothetical protein n=1 Tax=Brachybacterium muris TaxID=219301 RepID=UPI0021A4A13A|nr:hypothetical protein [Brachybacterium muris]MCT1430633.1 hypothetical protein [Brachybacterium muris]
MALLLHDGRTVPVTSLRKHQPSDFGTGISPWYQRAGAILQSAHQHWLGSRQMP